MGSEFGITDETEHVARTDGLAIFYAVFSCLWTFCLLGGVYFLFKKRDSPILRIRGIGLSIAAVGFLHCYWITVQFGYMYGPLVPGQAEYWIMGLWLPFGIALFHASNSRFLHVARAQRRYVYEKLGDEQPVAKRSGLVARFQHLDHTNKVFWLVGAGMVFQTFVTVLMYVISRKWHSSWGIPGTEVHGDTEIELKAEMGRGWEWWHTVFWQFFWAWIVAPYVLWQSRGIHDTQGWRVQTIACCLASLHATPMWLIAIYVPAMEKVNVYWIPPQWIAVSIMVLEFCTIFIPCWEVMRHQTLRQETLDSIAQWESKNKYSFANGTRSITSASTAVDSAVSGFKSLDGSVKTTRSNESILTMGALEHVLERNPAPLLQFSALRDFSGENIAFLTSVAEWRSTLPPRSPRTSISPEKMEANLANNKELVRERFNRALRIYGDYISARDADFQVNLPGPMLKKLEAIFELPARALYGDKRDLDPATPFDMPGEERKGSAGSAEGSEKGIVSPVRPATADRVQYWGEIPEGFNETVFDEAEASIKYLVLTNTWPKFVKERRSSMDSMQSV